MYFSKYGAYSVGSGLFIVFLTKWPGGNDLLSLRNKCNHKFGNPTDDSRWDSAVVAFISQTSSMLGRDPLGAERHLILARRLWSLRIKSYHFAPWRLCALARMSLLIQAVVLAKAQRRKGRKGKILAMVGLNSQRPSKPGEWRAFIFSGRQMTT